MIVVVGAFMVLQYLLSLHSASDQQITAVNTLPPDTKTVVINERGQQLFQVNCTACHRLRADDIPGFSNLEQRIPKEVLYAWIRNPDAVLKSGNKYFNTLVSKFGVRMIGSPQLSDDDIADILEYIRQTESQ